MSDFKPWYRNYVLGVLSIGYLLNALDRAILGLLLEPIKLEFSVSDTALGLLGGIVFAAFYSTLGIPIALWADRSNRRNILALSIMVWSAMTVLSGLSGSFLLLLLARIGTAIGEAGGNPPSQALITDYFKPRWRGTALSIFALGAPAGAMLAGLIGGIGNELFGWRITFVLAGLPGLLLGPLVWFTITEPRSVVGSVAAQQHKAPSPPLREIAGYLWQRRSFVHLCLACALHASAIYATAAFNTSFLIRSHGWGTADIGQLIAMVGAFGIVGTFIGGVVSDRCNVYWNDPRWYLWICGLASLLMLPVLYLSYQSDSNLLMMAAFVMCGLLSMAFFGPAFAATQALAEPRMRAVTASVLIFIKTIIGMGIGPLLIGGLSDLLAPTFGQHSLRYALLLTIGFELWAAAHFFIGARQLRDDLADAPTIAAPHAYSPVPDAG